MFAQADSAPASSAPPWKPWQYAAFRMAAVYLLFGLISLFLPHDHLLYPPINALYTSFTHQALPPYTPALGEPLFNYLAMYGRLGLSAVLALVWSLSERRGTFTERLFWPIHTLLRYYLASVLFMYGWDKVFLMQMPAPTLSEALTPLAEMSHMQLLWSAVGASPLFQLVGGWAEVVPGFLLLFRRTTLLGALLSAVVMGFVFLLNVSFDVYVKIASGHYLMFSLLLLTPYLRNLFRLLLNCPTQPVGLPATPSQPWLSWAGRILRGAALIWAVWSPLSINLAFKAKWQPVPAHSQIGGLYEVVSDSRPAVQRLDTDQRWTWAAFDNTTYPGKQPQFRVARVNHEVLHGRYTEDAQNHQVTLTTKTPLTLTFTRQPGGTLTLSGKESGHPFTAVLKPAKRQATYLMNEPSGWVIDLPDNH